MSDGQVQLPADGPGKALRTIEATPPATVTGGSDGYVHQQVATLGDESGYLHGDSRMAEVPTDQTVLLQILEQLRIITLLLADLADNNTYDRLVDEVGD